MVLYAVFGKDTTEESGRNNEDGESGGRKPVSFKRQGIDRQGRGAVGVFRRRIGPGFEELSRQSDRGAALCDDVLLHIRGDHPGFKIRMVARRIFKPQADHLPLQPQLLYGQTDLGKKSIRAYDAVESIRIRDVKQTGELGRPGLSRRGEGDGAGRGLPSFRSAPVNPSKRRRPFPLAWLERQTTREKRRKWAK